MIGSRRKAVELWKRLSTKALNQFSSRFSTSTNGRKLVKAHPELPQSSQAFAYVTQKLFGHVRMPRRFQVSDFGKTYWDACAIVRHESDSKPKPRWIPVLFQGEMADDALYSLKETEYAFIPGRVCAQPLPFSTKDQVDSGHIEPAAHDVSNNKQNHAVIPLLPLKSSIFVHDTLAAQLMYLVA